VVNFFLFNSLEEKYRNTRATEGEYIFNATGDLKKKFNQPTESNIISVNSGNVFTGFYTVKCVFI